SGGNCVHAIAAVMHFGRFNPPAPPPEKESKARFAGLKYQNFEELAMQENSRPQAHIVINIESALPHVPSKWENAVLSVTLKTGRKEYVGNLNNMRQLYFEKSLAASMKYEHFSLQDHQIIRFLAINAEGESAKLLLNSEQTAEFFHCLIGFTDFYRRNQRLIVHSQPAEAILLKRHSQGKTFYAPGIRVDGALLAMQKARVITGRSGCWIGTHGEYWWLPATVDIGWLRNFFRLNEQEADSTTIKNILADNSFPLPIVDGSAARIGSRHAQIMLNGAISPENALLLELNYLYKDSITAADGGRLVRGTEGFWSRDEELEKAFELEMKIFGFSGSGSRKTLNTAESSGLFLDKLLPLWMQSHDVLLGAGLARLCRGGNGLAELTLKCTVIEQQADRCILAYEFITADNDNPCEFNWKALARAARSGNHYYACKNLQIVRLGRDFRNFLIAADNLVQKLDHREATFELLTCSVEFWKYLARHFPAAIPPEFSGLAAAVQTPASPTGSQLAERFKGDLRAYQQSGVRWMQQFTDNNFNCVLADEMGLGKSVQTLALLASRKRPEDPPALIICPASLLENWKRECQKFVPAFKAAALSGTQRALYWENAADYDLIICSYAVARRDAADIGKINFSYLILDEAQHIKNPGTINAQSCKNINAAHRLVLTGTPLENSPDDLWSIFDFLQPGMLGTFSSFKKYYHGIGAAGDLQHDLTQRVSPFIKRRTKSAVCKELPPKIEQTVYCEMGSAQRTLYNRILRESRKQIRQLQKEGRKKASFEVLTTLLRLRQACCHPALLPDNPNPDLEACKLELLKELILENIDSKGKMLVFSQFTSLLKIVRDWLDSEKIVYEYLDGATRKRQQHVDNFNTCDNVSVFLLSLKAGGTGLNLTAASTVVIYDPWWNPAVEAQAADRTHRIGQERTVTSLKLVAKDSIEEKILNLQTEKQKIFDAIIEDPAAGANKLTINELKALL
ncbi:MAG: DEAD/DEAH box helicase, partial [Victivallales bacterium]|nr:DEAD/DEAH box helicase [Victivallales bacterium]